MCVLSGHGPDGHIISNFVMAHMADYIKHSKYWRKTTNMASLSQEEMQKAMRKCFRYAQDKVVERQKEL